MTIQQEWFEYLEWVQSPQALDREGLGNKRPPKATGLDRELISLAKPHEVRSWTESLGVTEQQLRAAVAAVGNSVEKVRGYLRKK